MRLNSVLKSISIAAGIFGVATPAKGSVAIYFEGAGTHFPAFDSTGNITGGALNGQNISNIGAAEFFGVEDGAFRVINAGLSDGYIYGNPSVFCCSGTSTTLTGGPLNGQILKNGNFLGAASNLNYYADSTGISAYGELGNHALFLDTTWTTFTGGGGLNGLAPARGMGLLDFAGNSDLNDGFFMNVEADGTLEYYNLLTGARDAVLELTYGSWTTFASGPLAGLTLNQLKNNPTGSINGNSYRFLGTSNDSMVFDVALAPVPEPSSVLLLSLASVFLLCRRRR